MKKVTMREIGKQAGVSTVTVSNALGGKPGMSDEVRTRILKIAKDLGYQYPEVNPQKLRNNLDIGILIPEAYFQPNSFYSVLYKKLITRLGVEGHFGLLELLTEKNEEALKVPHLIDTRHVDGLILLGQPSKEYYRMLSGKGTPLVFLDFYDEQGSADAVVSDNTYGCYRLTSHLIKNGHRTIGFVGSVQATSSIMDRYLGYYRAMLLHDLPICRE